MNIQTLENKKAELGAMALQLDEDILSAKNDVESSFFGDGDSDRLSAKLANLQNKRGSLSNAINSANEAIKQAKMDAEAIEADKVLTARKDALTLALKALDESHELQKELSIKLQVVADEVFKANPNNQEISQSIRGLVGRLANQFNLQGSLQLANTLKILNSKDDLATQQANLNGWR